MHFLNIKLSGIIVNNNRKSESPWKIPLWIFTSAKAFPPNVNSDNQFFMASVIYYYYYYYYTSFSYQHLLIVFHGRLSECKSQHFSWTFLSILADLNNAVVWIISARPLISKSSSLFISLWGLFRVH